MMQKKQRGMTLIAWVIILGLVAIQAIAALRIVPVYLDYYAVKKIMEEVRESSDSRGATPKQLLATINKRLNINGIYDLQKDKDAFAFQKTKEGVNIVLHYAASGPIYGNLEFVATFDHEVTVPSQ